MNERIKELAMQAGLPTYNPEGIPTKLEKFAELIVREFLDIASEIRGERSTDTHLVIGYDWACENMINAIKEHFGVE